MARRLTSSDWDAVLGSSSLRRISDSKPCMTGWEEETKGSKKDGEEVMEHVVGERQKKGKKRGKELGGGGVDGKQEGEQSH